jgi:hypothetical protein
LRVLRCVSRIAVKTRRVEWPSSSSRTASGGDKPPAPSDPRPAQVRSPARIEDRLTPVRTSLLLLLSVPPIVGDSFVSPLRPARDGSVHNSVHSMLQRT